MRGKLRNFVKFVIYDGLGMWNDYLFYFEFVCLLNEWIEMEKGLYLVLFFRGLV